MHTTSGRWKFGLALAATATLLWGILPVALVVMLQSMDAYTLTWYRVTGGALVLAIYLAYARKLPRLSGLNGKGLAMLFFVGCALCGNYLFYLLGLNYISPSASQVVIQVAPLLLLLGGLVFYREDFAPQQWLGVGVFVIGMLLFFHPKLGEILKGSNTTAGIFWVMTGASCWSCYALVQKQLLKRFSSIQIMFCINVTCAVLVISFANIDTVVGLDGFQLLLLGFCTLNSLLAYGSFAEALEHWEVTRVSTVLALSPIITILIMYFGSKLFPAYLAAENLDSLSILGAGLVVSGSLIASLWKVNKRSD